MSVIINFVSIIYPTLRPLRNLRCLGLSGSKNLIEMPDLGEALNLEWLDLKECMKLRQIHPSIGLQKRLTFLNLKDCINLVSLPNSILGLISLEYLSFSDCSKLYNIHVLDEPWDAKQLKKLYTGEALIHSQSAFSYSRAHKDYPIFPWMYKLDLSFYNLVQIPDAIGNVCCLESLDLSGNNFSTLPNLNDLSTLFHLNFQHGKQLKYLLELLSRFDFQSPCVRQSGRVIHFRLPRIS
ncbi:hypothetical protein JHK87_016480 [Glycine soja]|nr:hypothetical protein JHK87_016480 [Glycine soja]